MLQNILPSLIALALSLPLIFSFKANHTLPAKRIGLLLLYQSVYLVLIFLPLQFAVLSIPASTMNWSGKLLALAFSTTFYLFYKPVFEKTDFMKISPAKGSLKSVVLVGMIILAVMCALTLAFSKGKPLDIERLAYQATMPGLDEELWRGLILMLIIPLMQESKYRLGHPGVWFTTIIFALGHSLYLQDWQFGFAADAFVVTGVLGYILGWTILRTKSILPALILHNLINFSTNLLEMLLLSE